MIRAQLVLNLNAGPFTKELNDELEKIQETGIVLSIQYKTDDRFWTALIIYGDKEDPEAIEKYVGE